MEEGVDAARIPRDCHNLFHCDTLREGFSIDKVYKVIFRDLSQEQVDRLTWRGSCVPQYCFGFDGLVYRRMYWKLQKACFKRPHILTFFPIYF